MNAPPEDAAGSVSERRAEPTGRSRPRTTRRRLLGQVLRYGLGVGAAAVALDVVFGRRDELSGAVSTLTRLSWPLALCAVLAEVASMVCYAGLQQGLLAAGGAEVGLGWLTGVTLAANSIQNSLPVGPAWSTVYAYRQFRSRGADSVLAGWTVLVSTAVAFAVLGAIALVGLALSQGQAASLDLIEGVLVSAALAVLLVIVAHKGVLIGPLQRAAVGAVRLSQRLIRRPRGDPAQIVFEAMQRVGVVRLSRGILLRAFAWAAGNWLLDLSCLAIAFVALHAQIPWRGLLLAYGAAQLAANLPLTLGGLGVVEGSLTIALVFYGGAQASTVAVVLLYRIISFWLMLPTGWTAALVVRVRRGLEQGAEAVPS
ncbi:MAG TPA: YbhN family protein [Actinomycetota bacterium]|nr:YbhN family protein [Actinomycetota bacterium]